MANPNPKTEYLQPAPPWQPGQSGNPNGSSKKQRLTARLNKMLDEGAEEGFLQVAIDAAKAADFNFWKYLYERIDGKMPELDEEAELELKEFARKLKERMAKKKK